MRYGDPTGLITKHGHAVIEAPDRVQKLVQQVRAFLLIEADSLCAEFYARRTELQKPFMGPQRRLPDDYFSPLQIGLKKPGKGQGFDLYWKVQHLGRRGAKRKPLRLRKGRGTGYSVAMLLQHAQPFERELVFEVEERAERLRRLRKWTTKMAYAQQVLDHAPFARQRPVAPVPADSEEVVLPPGVTREAWEAYKAMPGVDAPRPEDLLPTAEQFRRVTETQ